jgi:hypothetical protein
VVPLSSAFVKGEVKETVKGFSEFVVLPIVSVGPVNPGPPAALYPPLAPLDWEVTQNE